MASRTKQPAEPIGDSQLKKRKVLVTDDDATTLESLRIIFESSGYDVVMLTSKVEAVRKLVEIKPDLVTTDLNSPEMSGLDFIRLVKQFDRTIPVIMISGNCNLENARRAMKLGADDLLEKPFDVDELRQVVSGLLKTRRT